MPVALPLPMRRLQRSLSFASAGGGGGGPEAEEEEEEEAIEVENHEHNGGVGLDTDAAAVIVTQARKPVPKPVAPRAEITTATPMLQRRKSVSDFGQQARAFNMAAALIKGEDVQLGVWTVRNTTVTSYDAFMATDCMTLKFVNCTFVKSGAGKWTPPSSVKRFEFVGCKFPEDKAKSAVMLGFLNFPLESSVHMETCLLFNVNVNAAFDRCDRVNLLDCALGHESLCKFKESRRGADAWKRSAEECH